MLRQAAIALSLANLCYLRIWAEILNSDVTKQYHSRGPVPPAVYLTVMGCVIGSALLVLLGYSMASRVRGGRFVIVVKVFFLMALAVVLHGARGILTSQFPMLNGASIRAAGGTPLVIAGLLVLAPVVYYVRNRILPAAVSLILILTPFVAVTFGRSIAFIASYNPEAFRDKPRAGKFAQPSQRIVWIIFDELDQHLAFEQRPAGLELPELDRFARSALAAANAYPPNDQTLLAMPALIQGRNYPEATPLGVRKLNLRAGESAQPLEWGSTESIFSKARGYNLNTGLAGWYHPYCRIFGTELTSCWWHEYPNLSGAIDGPLAGRIVNIHRSLFETGALSPFGQTAVIRKYVDHLRAAIEKAMEYSTDPDLGFVLLHMGMPHPPHAYNRSRGDYSLANAPLAGYVDSLALADVVFGKIRASMESAHVWDGSTVVVSSDHFYREAAALTGRQEYRVPFILKLPNQQNGEVYEPVLCTLTSHDLFVELMQGKLSSVRDVAGWLDAHRREADIHPVYLKRPLARRTGQ
jgi:hypothetical protein